MTTRTRCECLYCGYRWTVDEGYGWRFKIETCERCGEKKQVARREEKLETGDVFGYRFSPAFPPKW